MKNLKKSTLIALMFSSMSMAQTSDAGLALSKSTTNVIVSKAGEYIGEDCRNTLTHNNTTDNFNTGIMFDVEATKDIRISSVSIPLNTGFSGKVYVHRKLGTHVGSEGSPFNWLLVDSAQVTENGGLTYINFDIGLNMLAGETSALYIRNDGAASVKYKNGTAVGTTIVSDGAMNIKEGTGINGYFGAAASNRQFVGSIHYCTETEVVCDTTASIFEDNNNNFGIFFDVSTDNTPITIEQFYLDFNLTAIGESTIFHIYTRPGTFDGNEATNIGWTSVSADTIFSPTPNTPVATSDQLSITIPANSTQGFFLFSEDYLIDYSNGVNVGDTVSSEPNITIHTGKGTGALFGGSLNDGRNFNGVIDFCVASSAGLENLNGESFTISPNPANNSIHINGRNNIIKAIEIVNQQGKVVEALDVGESNGVNVDVSMLPPSVYFVTIETETGKATKRFVKL